MTAVEVEPAAACASLWPELLARVPALGSAAEPLPDVDSQVARRYGLYRDVQSEEHFMLRIKVIEATLAASQLRAIGELAQQYGRDAMELTTRQCVQLHWLRRAELPAVFARLAAAGLTTRGAGGSTVLNVTGCPVAGLGEHEIFDCRPQWHELAGYFQQETRYFDLPRKLKVTISTCAGRCNAPETNCIAFAGVCREWEDGTEQVGYDMLVGGGLGSAPRAAQSLGVCLAPDEVIDAARAAIDLWRDDPTNHLVKGKSRIKWMVDRRGIASIREAVALRLGRHLPDLAESDRSGHDAADHLGIHRQRNGDYYLGFPVCAGELTDEQAIRIAEIVAAAGGDVRLTRLQNLIMANVPSAQVGGVVASMAALGFSLERPGLRGLSAACSGQPYCKFAQAATKPMLQAIVQRLERQFGHVPDGLTLSIDGCPHACAFHWSADIGLQGTHTRDEAGNRIEAYDIFVRGCHEGEDPGFGHAALRKVAAGDVPLYVERLAGAYFRGRQHEEPWAQFVGRLCDDELADIARGGLIAPR